MKHSLLFLLMCSLFTMAQAQNSPHLWKNKQLDQIEVPANLQVQTFASDFRLVELDRDELAPRMLSDHKSTRKLTVPLPGGENVEISIQLDQVMAPGLAIRYPGIKTYRILADGKHILGGRLGWTHQGFHATLRTDKGSIYIDPYILGLDRYYVVYNVRDNIDPTLWSGFECGTEDNVDGDLMDVDVLFPSEETLSSQDKELAGTPAVLRKYRLAMACTGEFSSFHDGADNIATVEESLSAIVTIVNRVNEVWSHEIAVRLELIENNDQLMFLNAQTDPYAVNQTDALLDANPAVLDLNVGNNSYDVGHVLSTHPSTGQGVANLEGVCRETTKGRATSAHVVPQGDPFVVGILCHEMGHQFGATHVQSGCHNVSPDTAFEPGSGTTIMSYAGICGNGFNIQGFSEPYYNNCSIQQIFEYSREGFGGSCATIEDLGNTNPEVSIDYEDGFFIPISTPFELDGNATDMEDASNMTYSWEERDNEPGVYIDEAPGPMPGSPIGNSPLFRSWAATTATNRVFPIMSRIVEMTSDVGETLPTYSRNLTFRFTARDNHAVSGGVEWAEVAFHATDEAGPFLVTFPNLGNENWTVGDYTEVTWDVANTDADRVNCQRVNIRLSTDGGYTYPIMLLANTPNTGTAFVNVPDQVSETARIRVEAADNVFFDISNANFDIEAATEAGYTLDQSPLYQEICTPELATAEFTTNAILGFTGSLDLEIVSDLPDGAIAAMTPSTIQAGESSTLSIDFTNTDLNDVISVEVRVISDIDTTYRIIDIQVTNNDFSALALMSPVDGLSGVGLSESFEWAPSPNALTYDIEIAYSPNFEADLFESATALESPEYVPAGLFESNQLIFWRVRANNECGTGDWTRPFTLQTAFETCESATAQDTPINIPGTGTPPTRMSTISVATSGAISEVAIPSVNVTYSPIQKVRMTLESPAGTRVELFSSNTCFSTDLIFIGFDDDAPNDVACPPTGNIVYRPENPLSAFIDEESAGDWTLEVKIVETGNGSTGAISGWEIEFCSAGGSAIAPTVLNNNTLFVPPNMSNPITEDLLSMTDADQSPLELEYMIVSVPENGVITYLGQELGIGGTFRQASINGYSVRYENTNGDATEDAFTFIVQDGTGGFLPVQQFNIVIDPDAPVGTNDLIAAEQFRLFPNPASESVTLEWGEATKDKLPLKVYNLQGQLVTQQTLATGLVQWKLDTSKLPAGIYVVQVGLHTERLVIH